MSLLLLLVLATPLPTVMEEQSVLAAVQQFFATMAAKDVEGARQVLIPEGRFFSVRTIDGERTVRSSTNQEFIDMLATAEGVWLERMWDPEVRVEGDIATVFAPYDFHVNGEFSHCGFDAFDLVKFDGQWKIAGGTYTVERTGCAPSPLGPPDPQQRAP